VGATDPIIKTLSRMEDQTLWEKVYSYQNLRLAWTKVKEKGGGPGVDHMTLDDFEQNLDENLKIYREEDQKDEVLPHQLSQDKRET
jgi:retron-type reverse transcriptase